MSREEAKLGNVTERKRIVVAMSGGVDSSVAAARLCDAGYDVIGVTLHLWDYPDDRSERGRCCAPEDQHDARRAADHLGIAHFTFDRRELFKAHVVDPFVSGYVEGKTPSPCIACNRSVKMRELFPLADRLGAELVATGHYARTEVGSDGKTRLFRGKDRVKDQSYFLHMLRQDELARLVLPLGDATKEEVRAEALARRLPRADKGESQELCFVPNGRYGSFVSERAGQGRVRPGPIVDDRGRVVGQHEGVHLFTIGQRKGIGVALGRPVFVVGIDPEDATVRLGDEPALFATGAMLREGAWSDDVVFPLEADVRVRARHDGQRATIDRSLDPATGLDTYVVRFHEPVKAVSPGQIAVAYDGERVFGGALITSALHDGAGGAA
ncbi:MAG TPA: tRNA 2-thiouridine(34) synthase MnmA [Polyangium sp.]|nr:tRNA 2-thiouridine(34) synthase MnmA [Polyangium sp.]